MKRKFKQGIALFLTATMLLSFVGCGSKEKTNDSKDSQTVTEDTSSDKTDDTTTDTSTDTNADATPGWQQHADEKVD